MLSVISLHSLTPLDMVKQEAIKNLATYLEVIDKNKRERMADVYAGLQADANKWRIRSIIAGQIDILSKLFSDQTFNMIIMPLIFNLCKDNVSKVRERACKQIFYLIKNKKDNEVAMFMIKEQIKSFADFKRFTWRQGFVYMCEGLMEMPEFFQEDLLELFCKVCRDKVVNVRISAAKILARHIESQSKIVELKEIQEVIGVLKNDASKDVRRLIYGKDFDDALHWVNGLAETEEDSADVLDQVEKEAAKLETIAENNPFEEAEEAPVKEKAKKEDVIEDDILDAGGDCNPFAAPQETAGDEKNAEEAEEQAEKDTLDEEVEKAEGEGEKAEEAGEDAANGDLDAVDALEQMTEDLAEEEPQIQETAADNNQEEEEEIAAIAQA